jgi:DNA invertase Pin-like site-specific DNA recombinase
MKQEKQKIRAAIYTRKSTEEGLDKEFNTLDAQRISGEAYIKSQEHEGWEVIDERYDDGGFTGGNMDRPALKRLLDDIKAGKIDVVVVYKIDRLSRSLTDFAQMVAIFDEHNTSFVSVTQHFNTQDSMGRLTLNILFSFAQFEREVIGERSRDKFAASKQKGIFMGGALPLGYQVEDRKLYIDKQEAETVDHIFKRFVALRSITKLLKELNRDGYLTKKYVSGTGKERGGKPMNKQYLYRMFKNKIYLGKIVHKDKTYEGQHEAIISQELWDKAQAIFKEDPIKRGNYTRNRHPALLRGLVRCECCDCAMTPSFTVKKKRTYRYYTPTTVIHQHYKACKVGPIPASEIDALVVGQIKQMIESPEMLTRTYAEIKKSDDMPFDFGLEELRQKIKGFDKFWKRMTPEEQQRVTELLVKTVAVNTDAIKVDLRLEGFSTIINKLQGNEHEYAGL